MGFSIFTAVEQRRTAKEAKREQEQSQLAAEGAALSARRKADRDQRAALARKPDIGAIVAGERASSIDPTVLTSATMPKLGRNSALGNIGDQKPKF